MVGRETSNTEYSNHRSSAGKITQRSDAGKITQRCGAGKITIYNFCQWNRWAIYCRTIYVLFTKIWLINKLAKWCLYCVWLLQIQLKFTVGRFGGFRYLFWNLFWKDIVTSYSIHMCRCLKYNNKLISGKIEVSRRSSVRNSTQRFGAGKSSWRSSAGKITQRSSAGKITQIQCWKNYPEIQDIINQLEHALIFNPEFSFLSARWVFTLWSRKCTIIVSKICLASNMPSLNSCS